MRLSLFTIVVRNYDEAIDFYINKLGFELLEDTDLGGGKRWVRVAPRPATGGGATPEPIGRATISEQAGAGQSGHTEAPARTGLLLARAVTPAQLAAVGNQTAGRVMLFIETDDFRRDYEAMRARGVEFVRGPVREPYGTVAVFKDLHGNLFDLIQPSR